MTPSQRHPWLRPVRVHRHASPLLRRLEGVDMALHRALPVSYAIEARGERLERGRDGLVRRSNEIWRTVRDRRTGDVLAEELVRCNRAVVKYALRRVGA